MLSLQEGGAWCLVLELCSRGTLDMLIHHHKSPLQRPSSPRPRPQTEALIAAGIVNPPPQPKGVALARPDVVKLLVLMRGVARGILHLHTRSPAILHRDIKPGNIFISSGMQVRGGVPGCFRFGPCCCCLVVLHVRSDWWHQHAMKEQTLEEIVNSSHIFEGLVGSLR